ncbi:uncharacterized protein PRD47_005116 [Ara ararauna]
MRSLRPVRGGPYPEAALARTPPRGRPGCPQCPPSPAEAEGSARRGCRSRPGASSGDAAEIGAEPAAVLQPCANGDDARMWCGERSQLATCNGEGDGDSQKFLLENGPSQFEMLYSCTKELSSPPDADIKSIFTHQLDLEHWLSSPMKDDVSGF